MESKNSLKMNIKHCCRVCMAKNRAMVNMFQYKNKKIPEQIQFCSGILINPNDNFPPNICIQCIKDLSIAFNFKTKCLNSDVEFQSLFVKGEPIPKHDDDDDHFDDVPVTDYLEVEVPNLEDENSKLKPGQIVKQENLKVEKLLEVNITTPEKVESSNEFKNPLEPEINLSTNNSQNLPSKNTSQIYPEVLVEVCSNETKKVVKNNSSPKTKQTRQTYLKLQGVISKNKQEVMDSILKKFQVEVFSAKDIKNLKEIVNKKMTEADLKKLTKKKNSKRKCSKTLSKLKMIDASNVVKTRKPREQLKGATLKENQNLNSEDMNNLLSKFKVEMISSSDFMPLDPRWLITTECTKCNKRFKDRTQLAKHKKTAEHKRIDPFTCEVCGKMFASASSLRTHHKKHGVPQYYCDVCDYNTYERIDLTKHMNMHTGEFKYTCDHCQRVFTFKNNLRSHIRRVHLKNQEKKFLCSTCGKPFINRSCLEKHAQVHMQYRIYACDKCPSSFNQLSNYRRHMKVLHGVLVPLMKPGRRREHEIDMDMDVSTAGQSGAIAPPCIPTTGQSGAFAPPCTPTVGHDRALPPLGMPIMGQGGAFAPPCIPTVEQDRAFASPCEPLNFQVYK